MMKRKLILGIIQCSEGILLNVVATVQLLSVIGKLLFLDLYRDEKSMTVFMLFIWIGVIVGAVVNVSLGAAKVETYFSETSAANGNIGNEPAPAFKNINIAPVEPTPQPVVMPQTNSEWKCPNCGRVNQSYVGTCGCGTRKS